MLPVAYRLKNKNDFKKVYQYGRSLANQYLVLYILHKAKEKEKQEEQPPSSELRVGFSVSKKVGCAVIRNKIKRRMREAIRPYSNMIDSNVDLIFIARIKIKGVSYRVVEKNMVSLLKKAQLM